MTIPQLLPSHLMTEQVSATLHIYSRAAQLYGEPTELKVRQLLGASKMSVLTDAVKGAGGLITP